MNTRTGSWRRLTSLLVVGALGAGLVSVGGTPARATVPKPTGTNAVITVKAGGSRGAGSTASPLAGVQLALFASQTDTQPVAGFGTCTSDSDGDCSFTVPNTDVGGANRGRRFWIRQLGAPTGWSSLSTVYANQQSGGGNGEQPYQFQTGTELRAGHTYYSGSDFMTDSFGDRGTDSGGVWPSVLDEPSVNQNCGLHVALLLDLTPGRSAFAEQTANSVIDQLLSGPSTLSLYPFATQAPSSGNINSLRLRDAASARNAVSALKTAPAGSTSDWNAALHAFAQGGEQVDLAILVTGLGPTGSDRVVHPSPPTRFIDVEGAVFSANEVKARGIPLIGVTNPAPGTDSDADIAAVTGPGSYGEANRFLPAFLKANSGSTCRKTVTVQKEVIPFGGSTSDATPGEGYPFDLSGGESPTPITQVTDKAGQAAFNLTVPVSNGPASTFTERPPTGYTLVPLAGKNAGCLDKETGGALPVTNSGDSGFSLTLVGPNPITCTVYDQAPAQPASLTLSKTWVLDGTTYPQGQQPSGLVAAGTVDGSVVDWGQTRSYQAGQRVAISEKTDLRGRPSCQLVSSTVTSVNGQPTSSPLPYAAILAAGSNTVGISNALTCTAPKLTLIKNVKNGQTGGTAKSGDWTLTATNGTSVITGKGIALGAAVAGTYALSESGGPAGYTSSGWTCTGVSASTPTSVTIAPGDDATCTIINTAQASTLQLIKVVDNTGGGSASPSSWTLQATRPSVNGPVVVVSGTSGVKQTVPVNSYTLSETDGTAGYDPSRWTCAGGTVTNDVVDVALGQNVICTITNKYAPAHLTLRKIVDPGTGGTTKVPADFTLTATPVFITDQPVVTGNGDPTSAGGVNRRNVLLGSYDLSESTLPGFVAGPWSCTGASITGSRVTIADQGDDVTCTITNTAVVAKLTLVKKVDNGTTGGTATPADWTLTAKNGASVITGTTGVSGSTVPGTYTLSESGGPAGYASPGWVCTGATSSTPTSVTVGSTDVATCTITNTAQPATITLTKQVDNTGGGTAGPDSWTLHAAQQVTSGTPVVVAGKSGTSGVVPVGSYALSETDGTPGYVASPWTCTAGTVTNDVVAVVLGQQVVCTVTNTYTPGHLTLRKIVAGTTTKVPADWTLTAAPVFITDQPVVTGNGDPTSAGGVNRRNVLAGYYDLSESAVPGFTPGPWTCTGGTLVGTRVAIAKLGDDVTCTITNTAVSPKLTLIKKVDNGTTGGTGQPVDWTLTAQNGSSLITGTTGISAAANVGTYALSESGGPPGYTSTGYVCTGAASATATTVTLAEGNNATCTITNTATLPTLTLVKQVTNSHGGTHAATDWTLSASGPASLNGATGTPAVTKVTVPIGDYTLSEQGPAGYHASAWNCAGGALTGSVVTVGLGDNAVCTITNTDVPATLTLRKVVDVGQTGSGKVASDWTLTATPVAIPGQLPVSGNGDPSTPGGVNQRSAFAGNYNLTETGPAGFAAGTWLCTGGAQDGVHVQIPNGGSVVCTITNTAVPPRLTLHKIVDNGTNGGSAVATDWTLTAAASGIPTITGKDGDSGITNASARVTTYALSEAGGPSGYASTGFACTGAASSTSATVTLAEGNTATCTITNTAQPATLTLIKKVVGSAQPRPATDWTLTAAGPQTVSGATGTAAVTGAKVTPGTYHLRESGPSGYTASAWTCTGGVVSASSVTVELDHAVVCTITNTESTSPPTPPTAPPVGPPVGPAPPANPSSSLAFTGSPTLSWLVVALTLLTTGSLVLWLVRRRGRHA